MTATGTYDPQVGVPHLDLACGDGYIVVLASALTASDFNTTIPAVQAKFPAAKYLYTGGSCFNFVHKDAYVLYAGPFQTLQSACSARFQGTSDAYVKVTGVSATTPSRLSCLCVMSASMAAVPPTLIGTPSTTGPEVAEAQSVLTQFGYPIENATGIFDAVTVNAVKKFQADHSIAVSGNIDAATWAVLIAKECG